MPNGEPMIPPAERGAVVGARLFCVLSTGCQWQALPKDLPHLSVWCQRSILAWVCGWHGAPRTCTMPRSFSHSARSPERDVARSVVAEQSWFVRDLGPVAAEAANASCNASVTSLARMQSFQAMM